MPRIVLTLTIAMLMIFTLLATASAATIPIIIDGKEVQSDVPPVLVQDRTMAPIRVIAETLGAQVTWQNPDILIQKDDINLKLTLLSKTAYKNEVAMPALEVAPLLSNNRAMVPLRLIAEALHVDVDYQDGKVFIGYNPQTAFLTETDIIYQDPFTIFGLMDGVPYITSAIAARAGQPAEAFADSNYVRERRTDGQTVYFSYHPPGTEGGLTLLYAFRDGKRISAFKTPSPLYWQVQGDYIYVANNPYGAINDISTNKPPFPGNVFRVDITKDYGEQKPERLGVEGYLYGYDIVFTATGQFQSLDVKDGNLTPQLEVKADGIYAMGVELHAANARATYGYYQIDSEGRSHQKVGSGSSGGDNVQGTAGMDTDLDWQELGAGYNPPRIGGLLEAIKDSTIAADGKITITPEIKREFNQMGEDYLFFFMPEVNWYDFASTGAAMHYLLFTWTGKFGTFPKQAPQYEAEARLRKLFAAPDNQYPRLEHQPYRKYVMFDGEAYTLWPESYNSDTMIYDLVELKERQEGNYTYYTATANEYRFDVNGYWEPGENEKLLKAEAEALGLDNNATLEKLLATGEISKAQQRRTYLIEFRIEANNTIPMIVSVAKL